MTTADATTAANRTTEEILDALSTANRASDREGIIALFAEDGVFSPPTGPDARGAEAAADALIAGNEESVSATYELLHRIIAGDQAYAEFRCTSTKSDGTQVVMHYCDYFELRAGKIVLKSAFMKVD